LKELIKFRPRKRADIKPDPLAALGSTRRLLEWIELTYIDDIFGKEEIHIPTMVSSYSHIGKEVINEC